MTMTYDNLPAEQREWFDLFFGDLMFGSTYWTGGAELDDGRWTFSDREDVTDTKTYVITRDDVLAALAGDAGDWFREHGRGFFQRFGESMSDLDFKHMDYDADVNDCLVQLIVFGKVYYG